MIERTKLALLLLFVTGFSSTSGFCSAFLQQIGRPSSRLISDWSRSHPLDSRISLRQADTALRLWGRDDDPRDSSTTTALTTTENSNAVSESDIQQSPSIIWLLPSLAMIGLPLLSAQLFPEIVSWAKSMPANSPEQLQVVTLLFVSSRAVLYLQGLVIVALAARRSATGDSSQLGQRLIDLTEELLYRPELTSSRQQQSRDEAQQDGDLAAPKEKEETQKPQLIQSLKESGVQESLNEVSSSQQALILPVVVSALLAVSVFLVPFWNGNPPNDAMSASSGEFVETIRLLLQSVLPYVTQVWNAGLLTLFTRAEVRRLLLEMSSFFLRPTTSNPTIDPNTNKENDGYDKENLLPLLEWGVAAGITGVACLTPLWPVQNFVNMALAIAVARAIQLDRFQAVVGALALLTLYDVSSVFLIPAAGAWADLAPVDTMPADLVSSTTTTIATRGVADSAMGSVAIQKLSSETFQPGLLVTKIANNRFLGGSLGLGDAVFPSLLAGVVYRFDLTHEKIQQSASANDASNADSAPSSRSSLLPAALAGYLLGCAACDLVPPSISGLPALVFINPIMLGAVLAAASSNGELGALWNYNGGDRRKEEPA